MRARTRVENKRDETRVNDRAHLNAGGFLVFFVEKVAWFKSISFRLKENGNLPFILTCG